MPLSVNYQVLLFRKKTEGKVIRHINHLQQEVSISSKNARYTIIGFNALDKYIEFAAPENCKYPFDKKITIFYKKSNPEKFVMFNFAGLVLNNKMILPLALFIVWIAFYLSLYHSNTPGGRAKKNRSGKFYNK